MLAFCNWMKAVNVVTCIHCEIACILLYVLFWLGKLNAYQTICKDEQDSRIEIEYLMAGPGM